MPRAPSIDPALVEAAILDALAIAGRPMSASELAEVFPYTPGRAARVRKALARLVADGVLASGKEYRRRPTLDYGIGCYTTVWDFAERMARR